MSSRSRVPLPPTPFCEVEPAWMSTQGARLSPLETCDLCYEERPKYACIGQCGHSICWICGVRLRALQRDHRCPVCKEQLEEVAVVSVLAPNALELAKSASLGRKGKRSTVEPFGVICGSAEIAADVEALFDYSCWMQGCAKLPPFKGIKGLQDHLLTSHGRQFCPTCLHDRKVFVHEQLLYTPDDLERHRREGDSSQLLGRASPPTPAHARCTFCKEELLSNDDLLEHMNAEHHLCGLCQRQGKPFEYYDDFASLSLHYEESHYVCMHDDCRRGSFRLVAFLREEDLRIHEVTEHQARSAKGAQRAKKQGVRLTLQMGAQSYRNEQEQRRQGPVAAGPSSQRQASTAADVLRNANVVGDDIRVRFMRPKGKPLENEGETRKTLGMRRAERYPERSIAGHRTGKATSSMMESSNARQSDSGSFGVDQHQGAKTVGSNASAKAQCNTRKPRESVIEVAARGALARLLSSALREVDKFGVDAAVALPQAKYRERNKAFKAALQDVLGDEQLVKFKELSLQFRMACASADDQNADTELIAAYAENVCRVFAQARAAAGRAAAARLLSELVVLLPEEQLRRSLHSQLVKLRDREGRVEAEALRLATLPPAIEQVPCSVAFRGDVDGMPHFVSGLEAVLAAVVETEQHNARQPALARHTNLQRKVQLLDAHKAQSLLMMQQHLDELDAESGFAFGRPLDFSVCERFLTLQPLLQLKLKDGPDAAAWREWKSHASVMIYSVAAEEQRQVLDYVRLCQRRLDDAEARPGFAPRPRARAPPACGRKGEEGEGENYPALSSTSALPVDEAPRQGKRKGGRGQRNVLAAWG